MPADSLLRELTAFLKAARNLWGRCPCCGELFRLSDAAISCATEGPNDWLRRLQRERTAIKTKGSDLEDWQAEVEARQYDLQQRERALAARERNLDRDARARAREMLKDGAGIKKLIREAREDAVQRSRSTLLGKVFERLGPFLQRFQHDPRDIRPILDPCDYICFDGLTVNRRVERITLVEVKCGTSSPSPAQRSIVDAVREGRIGTEIWQFGERGISLPQQLLLTAAPRRALPSGVSNGGPRPKRS